MYVYDTLNDTFSWWAFTARAEGPRPNCAAIALRGCLPASCLSLVTSSAVQRRWMDLAIYQPPQPKTPVPAGRLARRCRKTRARSTGPIGVPLHPERPRVSLGAVGLRACRACISAPFDLRAPDGGSRFG